MEIFVALCVASFKLCVACNDARVKKDVNEHGDENDE